MSDHWGWGDSWRVTAGLGVAKGRCLCQSTSSRLISFG